MIQGNRKPDQNFSDDELLFFRFKKQDKSNRRAPVVAAIRFPDASVNREKYSEPGDVLIVPNTIAKDSLHLYGIGQFTVASIPKSISSHELDIPNFEKWSWNVVHDPQKFNYSHSEIRTYYDEKHPPNNQPSKKLKLWWRAELRKHVVIEQEPEV